MREEIMIGVVSNCYKCARFIVWIDDYASSFSKVTDTLHILQNAAVESIFDIEQAFKITTNANISALFSLQTGFSFVAWCS